MQRSQIQPNRPTHGGRHRTASLLALVLAVALAPLGSARGAAGSDGMGGAHPDLPLIALHYQDLLASEPAVIDLFVPPPPVEEWNDFAYTAADCLRPEGVMTGPPDKAIIVRFQLVGEERCISRVEMTFSGGERSWQAAALVVVNRLPDLPALRMPAPYFRSDKIAMPGSGPGDRLNNLLILGVSNPGAQPITVHGFGDLEAFNEFFGETYRFDEVRFKGRYQDIRAGGSPLAPTVLAPGEDADFALVLDAAGRLRSGASTLTVRPVALVEMGGARYTIEFPRISTAWGTELP